MNWDHGDIFHRYFLFRVDGKSHDALLVSYKCDAEEGTMELDKKWMKSILEARYGYTVYDCDVLRGKSMRVSCSLIKTGLKQCSQ